MAALRVKSLATFTIYKQLAEMGNNNFNIFAKLVYTLKGKIIK